MSAREALVGETNEINVARVVANHFVVGGLHYSDMQSCVGHTWLHTHVHVNTHILLYSQYVM